jgi:cob(I)alamin adenosyltransferase
MSVSTLRGDGGTTRLISGEEVSKDDPRVEAYGAIDELVSALGMARSICEDEDVCDLTARLQRELFEVCTALADSLEELAGTFPADKVEALTEEVHRIEGMDGILGDWALPGAHPAAAAFDVARTVCRRAERQVVRLAAFQKALDGQVVPYLNRLSDLLWLMGRLVEKRTGVNGALRNGAHRGSTWSRAW